ncbi:MYXO-CTERM sorting domain-containing protein [Nannocystis radixulma]|uniref:MYXO-CTERM sorting domain-containing protein n=1 Tax=Nannocystis radixulma TaxID=2995305 RepID=A0ABT5BJ32_9BACT|nr:MYXO-CTERM sorting domain-containing protein [Nannocystis radixulma]MDC0674112.1 MYXO-CTERM sorting domain-containing protein [Nannocystis radixulma]
MLIAPSYRFAGKWCAAALLALLAATSGLARADVVVEPESCPDGATPNACHSGPFCSPQDCSNDPTCPEGKVCQAVEKCAQSFECGGGLTTSAGGDLLDDIVGECGEGGTCAKGTCKMFKLCVSESATTSDTAGSSSVTGSGSGDSTASGGSSGASSSSGDSAASSGGTPTKPLGCDGCRASEDGTPALMLLASLALALRRRRR